MPTDGAPGFRQGKRGGGMDRVQWRITVLSQVFRERGFAGRKISFPPPGARSASNPPPVPPDSADKETGQCFTTHKIPIFVLFCEFCGQIPLSTEGLRFFSIF